MSLLSKIRGRVSDTIHAAEEAASGAAERAEGAAKGAAATVKERARVMVAAPPAPSAASLAAVSVNMAFTRDRELAAISVGVAKSTGAGVFHFDTRTEDTTGR